MKDLSKANDALSALNDIAESEPKFFKGYFLDYMKLVYKICTDKTLDDISTKDIVLETMITTLERIPSIVRDNENGVKIIETAVHLILNHMITNISDQIENKWCSPPEGYSIVVHTSDNEERSIQNFILSALDRLLSSVQEQIVIKAIKQEIDLLLRSNSDWRCKFVAGLALS